ncbi:MAG: hypothetical protein KFH87_06980 [Bacteroidetes bacterium]|nr:hypothetical protein [Bacteroidota bacterium]
MFIRSISGVISELTPNDQTRFQCTATLTLPLGELTSIEPGRLIAAENIFSTTREKRFTVLKILNVFPVEKEEKSSKRGSITLQCTAMPIGQELHVLGVRKGADILSNDTFPAFSGAVEILDDDTTRDVIHQIAPDSRVELNGSRIDIGTYRSNPNVNVGMDAATLLRGNAAVISARPRARTTMTTTLVQALLQNTESPVHIVYCDVNNMGTMSLAPLLSQFPHSSILCLNDKFVPSSVYAAMKNPNDRSAYKRAVLDYLDMMILPSVLEPRRHDFAFAIANWMRENRVTVFRPHEQTVDGFINDIRIDILDGVEEDAEEYISELMNGIAETYRGERFTEKNTRDMLDMVEEFSQESKSHSARRTLYDLKAEVQSVFESYSKDIPSPVRKSIQDVVGELNNNERSSLLVVQGQKTTDILRFISTLLQTLIEERIKRLKIRTPVLFIFNNIDEYVGRSTGGTREAGSERFDEAIQTLHANGRRHGLGFCLTLENAASLERSLANRIQSYFIGPITFVEEPARIADLLNLSEDLVRPAVHYEDGDFLFTSADSPYHRRVPLPVQTTKNTSVMHAWLDDLRNEQERRRQEYLAQEEERRKRSEQEREERRRQQEKTADENARAETARAETARAETARAETARAETARAETREDNGDADQPQPDEDSGESTADTKEQERAAAASKAKAKTTRERRKRGRRPRENESRTQDEAADRERDDDSTPSDVTIEDASEKDSQSSSKGKDVTSTEETPSERGKSAPAKKSTRSRRSRGKAADKNTGTSKSDADDQDAVVEKANTSEKNAASQEKRSLGLTIEEFDPDAGKRNTSSTSRDEKKDEHKAPDSGDASDAEAAGETSAKEKKKPARRSTRRRSPRTKKSDS